MASELPFWMNFLRKKWDSNIELLKPLVDPKLIKVMTEMHVPVPQHMFDVRGIEAVVLSSMFPAESRGFRFMNFRDAIVQFGAAPLKMEQGMYTGYAMELWPGDRIFCGYLNEGTADGTGVLYAVNRRVVGRWSRGALVGPIMTNYTNGSWCKGMYGNGNYNGLCTYYNDEMRFTIKGIFQNSRFNGPNILAFDNGVTLAGNFVGDRLNGTGTLTWPNGDKFIGEFVIGKRLGEGVFMRNTGNPAFDEPQHQTWLEGDDTYCLDGAAIHLQRAERGVIPPRSPPSAAQDE